MEEVDGQDAPTTLPSNGRVASNRQEVEPESTYAEQRDEETLVFSRHAP